MLSLNTFYLKYFAKNGLFKKCTKNFKNWYQLQDMDSLGYQDNPFWIVYVLSQARDRVWLSRVEMILLERYLVTSLNLGENLAQKKRKRHGQFLKDLGRQNHFQLLSGMLLPGGLNSENLLPLCVSCFKIQNAETSGLMWGGSLWNQVPPRWHTTAISKNTSEYCGHGARCWATKLAQAPSRSDVAPSRSDVLCFLSCWDEQFQMASW